MKTLPIASAAVFFASWEWSQLLHFQNHDFQQIPEYDEIFIELYVRGTPKSGYSGCHGNANTTDSSSSSFFASWERSQLLHFQNHDFLVDSALVRTDVKVRSFAMPLYVSAARVNPLIAKMTFNVTFNLQHLHLMCLAKCTYLWAECVDNVQ